MFLYTLVCAALGPSIANLKQDIKREEGNRNLIRATYPNYSDEDPDYAYKIFEDYAAPAKHYEPFIGYRRDEYAGVAVNISEAGFRKSINESLNDGIWFLGGSTMWGTGADDERTIPSYFAQLTGRSVLNLGESGFHSFQELVQLQALLAQGFRPSSVVFYDGVNDGYYFCQQDDTSSFGHSFSSRFSEIEEKLNDYESTFGGHENLFSSTLRSLLSNFFLRPLTLFTLQQPSGGVGRDQIAPSTPVSAMKVTKKFLSCDNEQRASYAARIMVNSWLSAAAILDKKDIPVWFVLQPIASYKPDNYELDHLIEFSKQRIVNTRDNYEQFYSSVRHEFYSRCGEYLACHAFVDLTEAFFEVDSPVFIDYCHVSHRGNEVIAKLLASKISRLQFP